MKPINPRRRPPVPRRPPQRRRPHIPHSLAGVLERLLRQGDQIVFGKVMWTNDKSTHEAA